MGGHRAELSEFTTASSRAHLKEPYLQIDSAVNPGNSGGPLLTEDGRVIGLNTLKVAGTTESIGFAIRADHVRAVFGDLLK